MIITRTPYRVSFVGGGSDLPAYYIKAQGRVVSCAINKHIYITLHTSFDPSETLIRYSKVEKVNDLNDIEHGIVRHILQKYNVTGVEITCMGDIPSKTGLGSSSSFTVGLLNAIHTYLGAKKSKEQLAEEASAIEMDLSNGVIGKQDQYAAAIGGLNELIFNTDGTVEINNITLSNDKVLSDNLCLFFTGTSRDAGTIIKSHSNQIKTNLESHENQKQLVAMVPDVMRALQSADMRSLGKLLDDAWKLKRGISDDISNSFIDKMYDELINAGCYGGKLLGAGGGGFILAVCPTGMRDTVSKKLGLRDISVAIDHEGTQVIHDDGERK